MMHLDNLSWLSKAQNANINLIPTVEENINLFEIYPSRIEQHRMNYILIYIDSIHHYLRNNNVSQATAAFDKLIHMAATDTHYQHGLIHAHIMNCKIFFGIILALKNRKQEEAFAILEENKLIIKSNAFRMNKQMHVSNLHVAAKVCMITQRYNLALDWIKEIYAHENFRVDIQITSRCVEMICHLELGSDSLIEHKEVALERYCKKYFNNTELTRPFIKLVRLVQNQKLPNKKAIHIDEVQELIENLQHKNLAFYKLNFITNYFAQKLLGNNISKVIPLTVSVKEEMLSMR
jgi:hypothetical protein